MEGVNPSLPHKTPISANVLRKFGFEDMDECQEYLLSRKKSMTRIELVLNL